ncbi:MAG: GAF domain-containing protein, partial [Terriglobales bacterium]
MSASAGEPNAAGEQLLSSGHIAEALEAFRAQLAAAPDDGRLLHRLTDILAMAGHLAEAAALQSEQFDRYLLAGRPREACVLFARLQWLQPQGAVRWRAYAEALEALEQTSEAEKAYRQCAAALRRERRPAEEIEAWRAVFRLHPADYSTCLEIASRAEACGDSGLAAQAYAQAAALLHEELPLLARAAALAPDDSSLRLRHTRALLAAGKGRDALAELAAIPAAASAALHAHGEADVEALRADAYIAAQQPEEAVALIEPHLTRADWFERGLRCLHALARAASPRAAEFAAAIEDKAGLEKRHLQWVRELHSLRAEVQEPRLLDFMADAFNRAGEEPAMLWTLHQALNLALREAQLDRAADMLERIVATDPNDPAPGERLAELRGRIPAPRWERLKAAVEHARPPAAAPRRGAAASAAAKVTRVLRRPDKHPAPAPPPPSYPQALSISQITPVIRALARETTPRRIFFSAVNHFGRVWSADRCLAANFHSGQDPVNVVEFCAPGVPSRYAAETTKLLNWIERQFRPPDAKAVILEVKDAPAEIAPVLAEQGIISFLAQPLNEAGSVIGAVVLESCSAARVWTGHDLQILEALAEQLVLVLGHARLRGLLQQFTAVDERT